MLNAVASLCPFTVGAQFPAPRLPRDEHLIHEVTRHVLRELRVACIFPLGTQRNNEGVAMFANPGQRFAIVKDVDIAAVRFE
jgi:hypothetical protein